MHVDNFGRLRKLKPARNMSTLSCPDGILFYSINKLLWNDIFLTQTLFVLNMYSGGKRMDG